MDSSVKYKYVKKDDEKKEYRKWKCTFKERNQNVNAEINVGNNYIELYTEKKKKEHMERGLSGEIKQETDCRGHKGTEINTRQ
jgi:hypothetical protein